MFCECFSYSSWLLLTDKVNSATIQLYEEEQKTENERESDMKKFLLILMSLLLVCCCVFAEEAAVEETADAITSATLDITQLPEVEAQENGILVVFFSPDDTTRAAAYAIAAGLNAELFEIEAAEPYTEDDLNYFNNAARSMQEMRDKNARPAIASLPENLDKYDTILLGYPVWGGKAAKIMLTFMESVDLSGKTIVPFCTSNTSPFGGSDDEMKKLAGDSVIWKKGTRIKKNATAEDIIAQAQAILNPEE